MNKSPGQVAYEAYCEAVRETYGTLDSYVPWGGVTDKHWAIWEFTAEAVIQQFAADRQRVSDEAVGIAADAFPPVGKATCPNGHECHPAQAPSCMVGSNYFWCGECLAEPGYTAASGNPAKGMYWPRGRVSE